MDLDIFIKSEGNLKKRRKKKNYGAEGTDSDLVPAQIGPPDG